MREEIMKEENVREGDKKGGKEKRDNGRKKL
jgi:hypothetical protein